MNITLFASGSRGDVQPYVALGAGLRAAGYTVRILTSDDFEPLVSAAGLDFGSIGGSVEQMLQSPEWRQTTESGNFLAILARMNREMKRQAQALARTMPALCAGSDLLIAGMGGITGAFSTAEKLGIPIMQAYVFPFTPTRAFASPLMPALPLGTALNRLSFHITRQVFWQSFRVAEVTTRRELGMPPASFWGPFAALERRRVPVLYGYSPHVLPRPEDWAAHHYVTGYWFLDADERWTPPDGLRDFLAAGPPPVYIGFGSMGNRRPEAVTQLALQALALSGQRGVLASGWGGLRAADLPETVFMLPSAPHQWLFPRMAAVVHHGGAGTTAAGLRAGVPSIVVPFFGDQPYWGRRVYELGVGPRPIPRRWLTAEHLAQAITQTVTDAGMRQRAAELGQKIRAEDGIGQAVALIRQALAQRSASL